MHRKNVKNLTGKSMNENLCEIIKDQTNRALWEVRNVIDCVPESLWSKEYCEMPLYKHIYHIICEENRYSFRC